MWPLLFLVAAGLGRAAGLRVRLFAVLVPLIIASFVWSVVETPQNSVWAYFSPLTRAWELAIGALLAVLVPTLLRLPTRLGALMSWAGIAGILCSAYLLNDNTPYPGSAAAFPVLAAAVAIAGGTAQPRHRGRAHSAQRAVSVAGETLIFRLPLALATAHHCRAIHHDPIIGPRQGNVGIAIGHSGVHYLPHRRESTAPCPDSQGASGLQRHRRLTLGRDLVLGL